MNPWFPHIHVLQSTIGGLRLLKISTTFAFRENKCTGQHFFILKSSHEADIGSYHKHLPLIPGANNLEGGVIIFVVTISNWSMEGFFSKVFPLNVCSILDSIKGLKTLGFEMSTTLGDIKTDILILKLNADQPSTMCQIRS